MKQRKVSPQPLVLNASPSSTVAAWQRVGWLAVLLCGLLLAQNAAATLLLLDKQANIRADHPQEYTVKSGDSLLDVIGVFVENPHKIDASVWHNSKIYPGNKVSLVARAEQPALQVQRGGRVVKLSPGIITSRDQHEIPKIPLASIRQFLSHPEIVEADELSQAPYVVSNASNALLTAANDTIYVRGMDGSERLDDIYVIVRPGTAYVDADENGEEPLAFGAVYLGEAKLHALDDDSENNIATFKIMTAKQEIYPGDRLIPLPEKEFEEDFVPSEPHDLDGAKIIGVTEDTTHIGQFQVVVLNRGSQDGLSRGNILDVYHSGSQAQDPVTGEAVSLPDQQSGSLLVFKVYERISFALVRRATHPLFINDRVAVP